MKSSEDDDRPLRSALRSGHTRTTNRVSFGLGAESGVLPEKGRGCGLGLGVASTGRRRGPSPAGGSAEMMERHCRLVALTSDLTEDTRSQDALDLWIRPSLSWSLSRHRPRQDRAAPPGGGGVSHMSAVLGGLLELVEQNWSGPGCLQRNAAFLEGAYDLLSELMALRGGALSERGGALSEEGGVRPKPANSEATLLRKRLERSELQLERMKKRLLVTLKENYELKRRRDVCDVNK